MDSAAIGAEAAIDAIRSRFQQADSHSGAGLAKAPPRLLNRHHRLRQHVMEPPLFHFAEVMRLHRIGIVAGIFTSPTGFSSTSSFAVPPFPMPPPSYVNTTHMTAMSLP